MRPHFEKLGCLPGATPLELFKGTGVPDEGHLLVEEENSMREKKTACVGKDVVLVSVKDIAALLWHNCRYEGIWLVENVPRFEVPLHKGKPTRGIKYKRRLDDCKRGGGGKRCKSIGGQLRAKPERAITIDHTFLV